MKRDDKLKRGLGILLGETSRTEKSQSTAPTSTVETSTVESTTQTPETEEEKVPEEVEVLPPILQKVQDEELKEALRQRVLKGRGRPKKGRPHDSQTERYSTVCIKANTEKWEKIKYISLQETLQIKELMEIAIDKIIEEYESKKGKIKFVDSLKKEKVFNK